MTEKMLVRQMKEGDKASFDLLYEKYKNMALRTAYLITGDRSYSEDVVQDTFVKVYLHCKELKNDSGFKAWMMQILVRTAYKCGRKKSRELPDEDVVQKADTGSNISLLEQVIMQEETEAIAGAEGARIDRSRIRLRLLSAPLTGARFFAAECPFNHQEETL